MTDTLAALLILPFLIALVAVLECSRLGCTHVSRRIRTAREARRNARKQTSLPVEV